MRRRGTALASSLSSLMLGACGRLPGTSAYDIRRAENLTAELMIDPASAEFQSVSIEGPSGLEVACGEVRGKDRTGSYGSFVRFVVLVDGGVPMIDPDASGRLTSSALVLRTVFDTAWNQECFTSRIRFYQQDEVTNILDPSVGPMLGEAAEAANLMDDGNASGIE